MIWIFENIKKSEEKKLKELNPFMDYTYKDSRIWFKTFCNGFEIRDGMVQEIRKIKFFKFKQTKQGFICNNIIEARKLCILIHNERIHSSDLEKKYPFITQHIKKRRGNIFLDSIAVPVRSFIEYSVQYNMKHLDLFDIGLLRKNGIDIYEYIPKKDFHTGEILTPKELKERSMKFKKMRENRSQNK